MTTVRRAFAGLLLALPLCSSSAAADVATPAIESIGVFYDVDAPFGQRGESLSVIRLDDQGYAYETFTRVSGLARLIVAPDAVERTRFSLDDAGWVQPVLYLCRSCDGRKDSLVEIAYDWHMGLASYNEKENQLKFELRPRAMDRKAWEIQTMLDLGAGLEMREQPTLEAGKLKFYNGRMLGKETLTTPAGEMETVKYRNQREGSENFQYIWYARELGWLPARWEIWRKDKRTWVIQATDFGWGEAAALAMRQDWLDE